MALVLFAPCSDYVACSDYVWTTLLHSLHDDSHTCMFVAEAVTYLDLDSIASHFCQGQLVALVLSAPCSDFVACSDYVWTML